uniref:Uncharacterized protein n=1 Tax=Chrysotila carterae TaxID=13221 RepID=A0A7S4BXS1_CHRCT
MKINQTLTSIDLSRCRGIGDMGCKALAEGLKTNQALASISLSGCCRIGDEGCKALVEGLKVNQTVTSINLSGASINQALTSLKINQALDVLIMRLGVGACASTEASCEQGSCLHMQVNLSRR